MTPLDFKLWRVRLGLTQVRAGKALGISAHAIWTYEKGKQKIPLKIALACRALETAKGDDDVATESGAANLQPHE